MKTALITHADCLDHHVAAGRPEIPDRLAYVLKALQDLDLIRQDAPHPSRDELRLAHTDAHIDTILQKIPTDDVIDLDPDTALMARTADAALRGAGAVLHALDGIMGGQYKHAFCATRPPGHHAEPARAMGFCYFSNVAIAALKAHKIHGLNRVAIVDFDVHHGNGTQACIEQKCNNTEAIYFASIHQHPHYPNTGGEVDAPNIRNVPLPGGTTARDWRTAFSDKVLTDLHTFKPELLLISAGFDAHKDDPLGEFNLTETDYAWLGTELSAIADQYCHGRMISVLEGGYNLTALAKSTQAYVNAQQ